MCCGVVLWPMGCIQDYGGAGCRRACSSGISKRGSKCRFILLLSYRISHRIVMYTAAAVSYHTYHTYLQQELVYTAAVRGAAVPRAQSTTEYHRVAQGTEGTAAVACTTAVQQQYHGKQYHKGGNFRADFGCRSHITYSRMILIAHLP